MPSPSADPARPGRRAPLLRVRVVATRWEAQRVISFELRRPDGLPLPPWEPGAHVDVHLPSGTVRQYSLCGDPRSLASYRIAVLELTDGRGGSMEAHRELRAGSELEISHPRADYTLFDGERYVFVAGGIGITPLLPMIREVARRRLPWTLWYGARSGGHFVFGDELRDLGPGSVRFVAEDTDGRLDIAAIAAGSAGSAVYCCGPAGLMDALAEEMADLGRTEDLHLERFTPVTMSPVYGTEASETFEVELRNSGLVLPVAADQTILEAVRAAGIEHPSSCEMGFCGTCETKVIAGEVDHRDDLLTEAERSQGTSMLICVSRAKCPRLTLDL